MEIINFSATPAVAPASSSRIFFSLNHFNKTIDGTEKDFIKSGIPGTPQYNALMALMEKHPTYTLNIIPETTVKKTYAGLTRDLMNDYLEIKDMKEEKAMLAKMTKDKTSFSTVKSWFLDIFPGFDVKAAKKEITVIANKASKAAAEQNLAAVKAKYSVKKVLPKASNE